VKRLTRREAALVVVAILLPIPVVAAAGLNIPLPGGRQSGLASLLPGLGSASAPADAEGEARLSTDVGGIPAPRRSATARVRIGGRGLGTSAGEVALSFGTGETSARGDAAGSAGFDRPSSATSPPQSDAPEGGPEEPPADSGSSSASSAGSTSAEGESPIAAVGETGDPARASVAQDRVSAGIDPSGASPPDETPDPGVGTPSIGADTGVGGCGDTSVTVCVSPGAGVP
jgi:hypothetical protein